MFDKFNQNTEFCPHCLTHEYFYVSGGSWTPARCPNHKDDDFILWKQMNMLQKIRATILFNSMWKEKYKHRKENEK